MNWTLCFPSSWPITSPEVCRYYRGCRGYPSFRGYRGCRCIQVYIATFILPASYTILFHYTSLCNIVNLIILYQHRVSSIVFSVLFSVEFNLKPYSKSLIKNHQANKPGMLTYNETTTNNDL